MEISLETQAEGDSATQRFPYKGRVNVILVLLPVQLYDNHGRSYNSTTKFVCVHCLCFHTLCLASLSR